jgi:CRISPR-associated protein Cas2
MLYVICYDISEDKTRTMVSDRLLNFGVRIQESVFECLLDEELFGRMLGEVDKAPLEATDRVRVYKVCADCVEAVKIYGPGAVTRDVDFYLV